jgi:hypothetical protein
VRELKIHLSDDLNERFRKAAMEAFGYGRGSISKAAEEALLQWCEGRGLSKTIISDAAPPLKEQEGSVTISADSSLNEHPDKQDALHGS